jgi:hypothetical protein
VAIWSMACRTASRSSDIALGCCSEAVRKASSITSGAVCGTGSTCGPSQLSCRYELATIALTGSPYDCQASGADADAKNYQVTDEGDQDSLANRGPPVWIPVIFLVGWGER